MPSLAQIFPYTLMFLLLIAIFIIYIRKKNYYKYAPLIEAELTETIDGDTIEVLIDNEKFKVRLIGINTPETVHPNKMVGFFGKEASNAIKQKLSSQKTILLEKDPPQGNKDKYKRLLRYVILNDGTNFNKWLIEKGFAYEYTYNKPYKYQTEFKEAEKTAQENEIGIWCKELFKEFLLDNIAWALKKNMEHNKFIKNFTPPLPLHR